MQSDSSRWTQFFLSVSVLFGAIVRFTPTVITGQPINDGGMFYVMIRDLLANRFLIPPYTTYNHLNIPFAYPPLSFYVGGLFSLLGIPIIEIIRWLPPLVSTLSIIAFYWMAGLMLSSKTNAVLATMVYALIPRSFSWYVMGGGLSRSFGMLFLILSCASAWLLFLRKDSKYIILTILCGSGAILSHPETGIHAAAGCMLIWIFKGRNTRGIRDSILVALGIILLTSFWWGTVLFQHGFLPFQSALRTGGNGSLSAVLGLGINLTEEPLFSLSIVFGIIGFVKQATHRNWFLLSWLVIPFIVEWRSATAIAILPLSILAGSGIADVIVPLIFKSNSKFGENLGDWTQFVSRNYLLQFALAFYLFYAFIGAFIYDYSLAHYIIPEQGLDAMKWIKNNSPDDSRFIVLTSRTDPFSDPTSEWFPAITSRTSLNTVQGKEWLLGNGFIPYLDRLSRLHACLNGSVFCITQWAESQQFDVNYIYLEKHKSDASASLLSQLEQDKNYVPIFENEGAVIFEQK